MYKYGLLAPMLGQLNRKFCHLSLMNIFSGFHGFLWRGFMTNPKLSARLATNGLYNVAIILPLLILCASVHSHSSSLQCLSAVMCSVHSVLPPSAVEGHPFESEKHTPSLHITYEFELLCCSINLNATTYCYKF